MTHPLPRSVDVLIVGAGAAGLAAGLRMEDAVHSGKIGSYLITEAADQPGGVIRTYERDGYLVERGPDMFFAEKPEVIEIAGRLGLARELIETNPLTRRSFIASKGRLRTLPDGFYLAAPSRLWPFVMSDVLSPAAKLRVLFEPFVAPKKTAGDESVASLVRRRFGNTALRRIAQPMVAGIYAGDPELLSARWAMPKFVDWERRTGSVIKGLRTKGSDAGAGPGNAGPRYSLFQSFKKGMGSLVAAMAAGLSPNRLHLNTPVGRIYPIEGGWSVEVAGHPIHCRSLILALPAHVSARLLEKAMPSLSDQLTRLKHESAAVIQVGWNRSNVAHPLNGMGFVVPAEDGLPLIAGSFSSVKFEGRAPKKKVLFRFFAGGAFGQKWLALSDAELWKAVLPHASRLLGLTGEPDFVEVTRYNDGMPQYAVGHDEWVRSIRLQAARYPGLRLAGAMNQGVGIPDAIRDGRQNAESILEELKDRIHNHII